MHAVGVDVALMRLETPPYSSKGYFENYEHTDWRSQKHTSKLFQRKQHPPCLGRRTKPAFLPEWQELIGRRICEIFRDTPEALQKEKNARCGEKIAAGLCFTLRTGRCIISRTFACSPDVAH